MHHAHRVAVDEEFEGLRVGIGLDAVGRIDPAVEVMAAAEVQHRVVGPEEGLVEVVVILGHAAQRENALGVAVVLELVVVELAIIPPEEHFVGVWIVAEDGLEAELRKHLGIFLRLEMVYLPLFHAIRQMMGNPGAGSGFGNIFIARQF